MPQPSQPNDNQLPGNDPHLTDAERAAREGYDDDGNEVTTDATAPAPPADGGDVDPAAAGADATDPAPVPPAEGEPPAPDSDQQAPIPPVREAPPAPESEAAPSTPTASGAGPVFAPRIDPGAPRDFNAELGALKAKYNAGDLDDDAYESAREEVIEARTLFKAQATIADQISQRAWEANINAFLQLPENATLLRSESMRDFWQAAMNRYCAEEAAEGRNPSDWEILTGARDKLYQEMGISTAPTPPAPAPQNPTAGAPPLSASAPPPVKLPNLSNIPPSIGSAPNAGATGAKPTAEALAGQDIFEIEKFMSGQSEEAQDAMLRTLPGSFAD